MDVNSALWHRRGNGTVEISELPLETVGAIPFQGTIHRRYRYTWKPPFQISRLPAWYRLALDCNVLSGGIRRFSLINSLDLAPEEFGLQNVSSARGLSMVSSLGGLRLLQDRGEVESDLPFSYDVARLFLRHFEHRQGFLGRTRQLEKVLNVCAGGRADASMKNILPEDIGLDPLGNGDVWNVERLKSEGLKATQAAGLSAPTVRQIVSFGMLEAAKINPLYVETQDDFATITRMAFFSLRKSSDELTEEQVKYVATHVTRSVHDHLADSDEQFELWITDSHSNLVSRIFNRTDCAISRDHVQDVFLELGWRSFQMLGKCIDVQMSAFQDAIPEPLTDTENFYYSQVFRANPIFGGLPLIMLYDRYDFLREAILAVWNQPNDPLAIAVLCRMLFYYSVLMGNRRAADCQIKRVSQHTVTETYIPEAEFSATKSRARLSSSDSSLFCKIAQRLAVPRGCGRDFDEGDWQAHRISENEQTIIISLSCPSIDFEMTISVGRAEFEAAAKEVQEQAEK